MDKFLRPQVFSTAPNELAADKAWKHWLRTLNAFIRAMESPSDESKLDILVNYISPSVYEFIVDAKTFDSAVALLTEIYVKPPNEIFARHLLATRRQNQGESIDEYLQSLKALATDCNFVNVLAIIYRDESIRDAFITGLQSTFIRQRLLENKTLTLQRAIELARTLDSAHRDSEQYISRPATNTAMAPPSLQVASTSPAPEVAVERMNPTIDTTNAELAAATRSKFKCYFCGGITRHSRQSCPAKTSTCRKCQKRGHFAKVCMSSQNSETLAAASMPILSTISATTNSKQLSSATVKVEVAGKMVNALIDTGSTDNFISQEVAARLKLQITAKVGTISMASSVHRSEILGVCSPDIKVCGRLYRTVELSVIDKLCADIILGHSFLKRHKSLNLSLGGTQPTLEICGLAELKVSPPELFANIDANAKPIATKSRRYSTEDKVFIDTQVELLLEEEIIEPSTSPWRAQVVITGGDSKKRRMVIDYSQTVNKYTSLDAYPLPRIDELVDKISKYRYFSKVDLKSAYYLVPLKDLDKPYTAFEANHRLYQFRRMPLGCTNGVACFQRFITDFIGSNRLKGTFAYLDDVTICGSSKEEHDENLRCFREAAQKVNLTLNEGKCLFGVTSLSILGYLIAHGKLQPDPDRLQALFNMPIPTSTKAKQRLLGFFSHYSRWIPNYSEKIRPLVQSSIPFTSEAKDGFERLKRDLAKAATHPFDDLLPLVVETDASDFAIAATLSQDGRPIAFFSRTLNSSEQKHSSIEKEAQSIVEAVRKWRHYLASHHFTLITDQKSVSFMFDIKHSGKIKNDKILRWRLELSPYSFDIQYRPGNLNVPADALSRVSGSMTMDGLSELHASLCHPGVVRMIHFIRTKNLPYSVEDVKKVTRACRVCCECKPRFYKPEQATLIKAMRPFERISMDFKGPLPSSSAQNKYLLIVVDEYSRFPFAFPCKDTNARTVIACLCQIFAIFGMPDYIHSDRGSSFMSRELGGFLHSRGIATSRTSPYSPQANGQCERFVGIVWKTIELALKSRQWPKEQWEWVLPDAMHCIRSLLSTATNQTPHERLFAYPRRSSLGYSLPHWLANPGPVLLRRHVRSSKYEPLVDEVELLEANDKYAHIRHQNGRETTVSVQDLAPPGETVIQFSDPSEESPVEADFEGFPTPTIQIGQPTPVQESVPEAAPASPSPSTVASEPRRSERVRQPPERWGYH